MKNIYLLLITIVFVLINIQVKAQNNCAVVLKQAQKFYENGSLEEIPNLLKNCLSNGFSKDEKIEAIKLLILCDLYDDKIVEAEKLMLQLFKLNPEYKINPALDAAEFIHLYNTFNTRELFSIGIIAGMNFSNPYYRELFGIHNINENQTKYKNKSAGFILGPKISFPINEDIHASVQFTYAQKQFEYENEILDFTKTNTTEVQNYIEIPITVRYYKFGNQILKPFVELGLNASLLSKVNASTSRIYNDNSHDEIPATEKDISANRNKYTVGALTGLGATYYFQKGNVSLCVNYNFALSKITNNNRYNNEEQIFNQFYIDDKIFLNNLYVSVAFMTPIYNHKKID